MPLLPPRDWFSPLKRALCLKTLHPFCYAKEKMEDFQFNLGWAEGRSAIWTSIVLAEPTGTTLASPQRQLSRTERRTGGIIDRQEKGGPLPLCLIIEREKSKRRSSWEEKKWRMRGRTRRRGVITCNMLPRANSDYMKCLAHVQDFSWPANKAKKRQWEPGSGANKKQGCCFILVDLMFVKSARQFN